jgi:ABC-type transport system involved in multi-copper enzyme maturation permease subunit
MAEIFMTPAQAASYDREKWQAERTRPSPSNNHKEIRMHTVTVSAARRRTLITRRTSPLMRVVTWELRRVLASRLFWVQALCYFVLMLYWVWVGRESRFLTPTGTSVNVIGTSAWGLMRFLPNGLGLLGLLMPFVTADGVARDLHRRTHELVMTTALPTWAYVWGRYLAVLLMGLGLAVVMLVAILGEGVFLHFTVASYPVPDIGNVLILWGAMVVSATILLSSVSFALGTQFPRQSLLSKIGIVLAWFIGTFILPGAMGMGRMTTPPAWYSAWDPTGVATAFAVISQFIAEFQNQTAHLTSAAQAQHLVLSLENTMPDLAGWFAPHLVLAGVSLLVVMLAVFGFQRFRNTFGG